MSCMSCAYFGSPRGLVSYCNAYPCYLDTVEVWGSSPHGPTISFNGLAEKPDKARAQTKKKRMSNAFSFALWAGWARSKTWRGELFLRPTFLLSKAHQLPQPSHRAPPRCLPNWCG